MNSYINRRDGAVSAAAAAAAPPPFEGSDERRREREKGGGCWEMFSWEAAASVVEPLRQDPVVCGPITAPPSVSPHVSVTVLLTNQPQLLPPPPVSLLHLVRPLLSLELTAFPSSRVSSASVTRERCHFLSTSHALYFSNCSFSSRCRFKQNV